MQPRKSPLVEFDACPASHRATTSDDELIKIHGYAHIPSRSPTTYRRHSPGDVDVAARSLARLRPAARAPAIFLCRGCQSLECLVQTPGPQAADPDRRT